MARKKGRGIGDAARYTSASSRPPSYEEDTADDSIVSGTSFFLISLVVFLAIVVAAVNFGTKNIEADLQARSEATLQAAGFDEVVVLAEGATVHLSGSISTEQTEEAAFATVSALQGVHGVEGKLWPVFSGELDEIAVTGDALRVTWKGSTVSLEGNVSSSDRQTFVIETLSPAFRNVDIEALTVLEGLDEGSGWLGASLGLLLSLQPSLDEGTMTIDPNGELLIVSGDILGKDARNELNARVVEVGDQLGFDVIPAIRVIEVGPTVEEIEELQFNLDEVIEGKVVEFEVKSFSLTPKGITLLDEILAALTQAPEVRIEIAGHTDSRGSSEENLQLSNDRADAVLDYLVAGGESKDRFEVVGYGEDQPAETNDTAEGRARNRRIEFTALEGTS
jgi:outer membrane protein OmpA-like peptidoglycan-associated protein